jgi:hypothetical protein
MKFQVPDGRDLVSVLRFSSQLAAVESLSEAEFCFAKVRFTTPGWMMLMVRALRDFRDSRPGTKCRVKNTNSNAMLYAGHAGFFDALGMRWSRRMGEAATTSTFIPITERAIADLFANQPKFRAVGDVIQDDADNLAAILTQDRVGTLFDTLSYALREIIRNVVEHAEAADFRIAAQCWVAQGIAELAISDKGIGIAASLAANSKYAPTDDAEALLLATQPGVSGVFISERNDDAWANSGYGLFMAKGLGDGAQGFILASGSSAVVAGNGREILLPTSLSGTCVILRLRAGDKTLQERLSEMAARGGKSPSRASMSVRIEPRGG